MRVYSTLDTAELTAGASQIPDCSQIFELLISQTNATRLPTLAELVEFIRTLWDPWTCPVSELKLLAWAWSVDVFEEWWPEPRKRRTIAESRLYHSRKTTTAGVRMALGYRDASLVRVNTPRMGFFADVPVSAADEARWRAGLPEIRIYDPAPAVLKRRRWGFAAVNLIARADARLARTAVLVRDGVETALRVIPLGDPEMQGERIVLPVPRVPAGIVGRGGRFIVAPVDVGVRVLAIRTGSGDDFSRPVATAGDVGTFVQTRRRQVDGAHVAFTAAGRGGGRFAAPVVIARGYTALSFSDSPGRRAARAPLNVVGKSRVMRDPYTANFLVDWHQSRSRSRLPAMTRVAASSEPVARRLMEAVVDAQAARDRDTISFSATRRLTYADLRSLQAGARYGDRRGN